MRVRPPALAASGLIAAVLALSGCGGAGEGATAAGESGARCAIVVDATQSVKRVSSAQLVQDSVPKFLQECATVHLQPISANSQTVRCRPDSLQLNPGEEANNPTMEKRIRNARVKKAVQKTGNMFECTRTRTTKRAGSDIAGALVATQQDLKDQPGPRRMLLLSDLLEKSDALNLYQADVSTQAERAKLLDRLERKGLIADLDRTALTVRGFALGADLPPERVVGLRKFWQGYFQRAGAQIASWR